ncbi:calcium calmodulin dependent protein kinase [Cryptosporidium ubiquitum]|uniref:Calcium-dependent protein kinase 1 n=1 Tax=Cryptosporidium ubiquitum TaxID=857276 RepID=A0A1J4MGA2_9CRYT|nr:calcium calmodulin dependent protein kinase [Cryptosporidium ubiquitum]OII72491.1 calcium calmodulin dependent protein kinase [Cryptosporidium ubiquitum]
MLGQGQNLLNGVYSRKYERHSMEISKNKGVRRKQNNKKGDFQVQNMNHKKSEFSKGNVDHLIKHSNTVGNSPDRYLAKERKSQASCSTSDPTSPSAYRSGNDNDFEQYEVCDIIELTSNMILSNEGRFETLSEYESVPKFSPSVITGLPNTTIISTSSSNTTISDPEKGIGSKSFLTEGKFRREGLIPACKGSIHSDYIIDSGRIGKGTYGSVKSGTNRLTGCIRAIKTIPLTRVEALENFMKEINILKNLDHPNIVKLYETYQDKKNIYLVMELCSGGELFDRIISQGSFDEIYAANLMKQVLSTICYCHDHGIVHRDLKPENFLFLNKNYNAPLKIIDFGLAARVNNEDTSLNTRAGTPYYVAPEVLQGKYDKQCDMWSLGVILYILLCGYPPFHGSNDSVILHKVQKGVYAFKEEDWKHVSFLAIDLIRRLLTYNPADRITARDALNHPWITRFTDDILFLSPRNSMYYNDGFMKTGLIFNDHVGSGNNHFKTLECQQRPRNGNLVNSRRGGYIKGGLRYCRSKKRSISSSSGLNLLSNFRAFHKYNRFMKVALTVIAQQMTESQISNLKEAFILLDANCDGTLTPQEVITGLKNSGITELPSDLLAILNDIDSDGSGSIDYTEFIAATLDSKQYSKEHVCWAAFKVFDQDGNGKITANELLNVFSYNSEQGSTGINDKALSDVKNMIKEVDVNGDGEIDFQEFLGMFRRSTS